MVADVKVVAILYNIRSLYNVGSIFRTADAVGVGKIYLSGFTPAPLDRFGKFKPRFAKVSLGAEKSVAWDASARSTRATLKLLAKFKKAGYKIFAIEQSKNSIPYHKIKLTSSQDVKLAVVVGNEINGLPPAILKKADKILEIPMRGAMVRQAHHPRHSGRGKESLNVSVAFGVVAYFLIFGYRQTQ